MTELVFDIEDELEKGFRKLLAAGDRHLLFVMGASGPAVIEPVCPHAGSSLADGRVVRDRIRCSRHGYLFDLATGGCSRAAEEGFAPLKTYDFNFEDGKLTVHID